MHLEHTFHQLLVDAYEVLCDVLLRRTYDKMGPGALPQPRFQDLREYLGTGRGAPGGPSGGVGRAQGQRQGQGQGQGPAQGRAPEARRGRDVHTVLGLMLSEAAAGVDKTVTYTAQAVCEDCKVGSGHRNGAHAARGLCMVGGGWPSKAYGVVRAVQDWGDRRSMCCARAAQWERGQQRRRPTAGVGKAHRAGPIRVVRGVEITVLRAWARTSSQAPVKGLAAR